MLIKKMLLLSGFSLLAGSALLAQETPAPTTTPAANGTAPAGTPQWSSRDMTYRGKGYDVLDSAYYDKRHRKQYHQYMEHQTAFPPMPRNQFEVGLGIGMYNAIGDIPSLNFFQKGGGGIHLHVRKAWGYVFSTRFQFIYGVAKNLDVQRTQSYGAPYTTFGYVPLNEASPTNPATSVYRATRMESAQYNLDLMFNIKNISFHQARNTMSFYGYFGLGVLNYKTRVNALDATYTAYNFGQGTGGLNIDPKASNKDVRKALQSKMDKSYESDAEKSIRSGDKKTMDFAPSLGAGVSYKINKKINISLEDRFTIPAGDDYLDGTRYGRAIGSQMSVSQGTDVINYLSVGVNYNVPNKKKSVEPLYWLNPLDHAYNELSYPRHMLLPNPVLPDEDNDGVTDQFDKCPKTPASVAVDGHGCPMDTDGDGVPDYKDKQLITPTECQPVDADGVGHCPCPEGCGDITKDSNGCPHIKDGVIRFGGNANLTPAIEGQLAALASQMKMDANCKVVVMGGGGSKVKEQKAWERVNAVISYMTDKQNIIRDRFIFKYGQGDDDNVVMFRAADRGESGPSTTPPPHPNLK